MEKEQDSAFGWFPNEEIDQAGIGLASQLSVVS